jgi:hypothetical protein
MANYWGMNQWTGQQIGEAIFLDKNGNARMIWNYMVSPHGIQQLAKAEMKRSINEVMHSTSTAIDNRGVFKVVLLVFMSTNTDLEWSGFCQALFGS